MATPPWNVAKCFSSYSERFEPFLCTISMIESVLSFPIMVFTFNSRVAFIADHVKVHPYFKVHPRFEKTYFEYDPQIKDEP